MTAQARWTQDQTFLAKVKSAHSRDFELAFSSTPQNCMRMLARNRMAKRYEGYKLLAHLIEPAISVPTLTEDEISIALHDLRSEVSKIGGGYADSITIDDRLVTYDNLRGRFLVQVSSGPSKQFRASTGAAFFIVEQRTAQVY